MSDISTEEDTSKAGEGERSAPASTRPCPAPHSPRHACAAEGELSAPASARPSPAPHPPRHARAANGRAARSPNTSPPGPVPSRTSRTHARKPVHRQSLFWAFVVIAILIGASIPVVASVGTTVDRHAPKQTRVTTYSVIGSGTSSANSITYQTIEGGDARSGTVQETGAPLPWRRKVVTSGDKTSFFVRVQNGSVGLSYVICTISQDGAVLSSNKAEGPYAVASCSTGSPGRS